MMKKQVKFFLVTSGLLILCSCNFCFVTHPSCLLAPQATTNVKKNKYYEKDFKKTDTILSTKYVYELIDTLVNKDTKYKYQSFLFYNNGLVLHEEFYTNYINNDTLRTFTQDIIRACCHGADIGSYTVKSDTIYFGTKIGYMKDWNYYSAKVFSNGLIIFEESRGKVKTTDIKLYVKNRDKIVLKNIKI